MKAKQLFPVYSSSKPYMLPDDITFCMLQKSAKTSYFNMVYRFVLAIKIFSF